MSATGRVVQVSVSRGGVPKRPVAQAWVGRLGLEGDAHREHTVHGGPHRAVCLFGIEAIERLQAEGHPVEPGSVGENLTTTGIEWSTLPIGTRARVGDQLLLELASSTTPCETQRPNFSDGRFSRINIALHPADSRMYARVLEEGVVRPGDEVELLAPALDSRALVDAMLLRIDPVEKVASVRLWSAARAAGYEVSVLDDGELCAGASVQLPGSAFNHAQGLRTLPQLLPDVLAHFDGLRTTALIPHVPPRPDSIPVAWVGVHAADPSEVVGAGAAAAAAGATGAAGAWATAIAIEQVGAHDEAVAELVDTYAAEMDDLHAEAWRGLLPHLLAEVHVSGYLARVDGIAAGVGFLHVRRKVGLIKGAYVIPQARGKGIQRALVATRAAAAARLGCDLVAAMAEVDSISAENLVASGLTRIGSHPVYEYVPA